MGMEPAFPAAALDAACADVAAELRTGGEPMVVARVTHTALALAEAFTGGALIARQWTLPMRGRHEWQSLRIAPVRAITQVRAGGVALPPGAWEADIDAHGTGWVRVGAPQVEVAVEAGIAGDWAELPAPVRQGVVMLAAHLFNGAGREGPPPAAVGPGRGCRCGRRTDRRRWCRHRDRPPIASDCRG